MSGKRDSNPRPSAWEADALPTELLPQIVIFDCKVKQKKYITKRYLQYFSKVFLLRLI